MSKIGKKPIRIPEGVAVEIKDRTIHVKGPKGEVEVPRILGVQTEIGEKEIHLMAGQGERKQTRSNWGTLRSLIQNAIVGVTEEFEKTLILEGVGFRVVKQGNGLELTLGFSHPVKVKEKKGIEFQVEKNVIKIRGVNKELVGQTAAEIRALKKPEPYKGKGLRYDNEVVRRKAGKKVAGAAK